MRLIKNYGRSEVLGRLVFIYLLAFQVCASNVFAGTVSRDALIGRDQPKTSSATVKSASVAMAASTASTSSFGSPENLVQNFQFDPFSGAGTFQYPIVIPPGRAGVQPAVGLSYSPRGGNDLLGVGWSIDFGSIERSTKDGIPQYNGSDKFISTFGGGAQDLISIGNNQYRAQIEGGFVTYTFDGDRWTAQDQKGNTYYFGLDQVLADNSRIKDPANNARVYRWRLSEAKDIHGNYYFIKYLADGGFELYYTGEPGTDRLAFGSAAQKFAVKVTALTESLDRNDGFKSYRSGFLISRNKRLSEITVEAGGSLYRKHIFKYHYSQQTGQSLLDEIVTYGANGTSTLPSIKFAYRESAATYSLSSILTDPTIGDNLWNHRYDGAYDRGHETYGACPPTTMCYGVNWGPTSTVSSASLPGGSMSVASGGYLRYTARQDTALHFWTYLYVNTDKTISVPWICNECDTGVWINGNYSTNYAKSWPLKKGYNLVEITDYHQHQGISFNMNSTISNQVDLMNSKQVVVPNLVGDFNGDGRSDVATYYSDVGNIKVSLSTGADFTPKAEWLASAGTNQRILLGDFNADGRTDISIVNPGSGEWKVALSDGAKFNSPTTWLTNYGANTDQNAADVNGDGRTDFIYFKNNASLSVGNWKLNLPSGLVDGPSNVPVSTSENAAVFLNDVNGDGVADFTSFLKSHGLWEFLVNDGKGGFIRLADVPGMGQNKNPVISDFNADGRTDIGYYDYAAGLIYYRLSQGETFTAVQSLPINFNLKQENAQVQAADFNGDSVIDYAVYNELGNIEFARSNGLPANLMQTINNGLGGLNTIEYQPSSNFSNTYMPFIMPLITSVTLSNAQGQSYTNRYFYANGLWDVSTREFRGFGIVRNIDPYNNYIESRFLQGFYTKGRPSEQRFYDSEGNIYNKTVMSWNDTISVSTPEVRFVFLERKLSFIYDGQPDTNLDGNPDTGIGKATAESYVYGQTPQYGNLTQTTQWGEVDLSSTVNTIVDKSGSNDTRIVDVTYTPPNATNNLAGLPSIVWVYSNSSQNLVRKTEFAYDNLGYGQAPTKGLLTKRKIWGGDLASDPKPETSYVHNSYGNLVSTTDPIGKTTTITYDSTYQLFPVTITNAKNHTVNSYYFGINATPVAGCTGLWGQVYETKDPNDQKATSCYDTFGRNIKSFGPKDSLAYPTSETKYDFFNGYAVITSKQRVTSGQAATIDSYAFIDGLGRTIETKTPSSTPGQYAVSGLTEFNNKAQPIKKYISFFSTRPVLEIEPIDTTKPFVKVDYDVAGRVIQSTNPDGTYASMQYNRWNTASINENGHKQESDFDAYGRLIEKREYSGADGRFPSVYALSLPYVLYATTKYQYDSEGNLIKTTDAQNNQVVITYDKLGRKIAMSDPDMGNWTYSYDLNGNLTKQIDAKGQTINFVYDDLNRLTRKYDGAGLDVNYAYDASTQANSKGRLTQASYGLENTKFEYDELGRELKSIKNMNGADYSVQRSYDALNRLINITYPDGQKLYYKYNGAGQIEKISTDPAILNQSKLEGSNMGAANEQPSFLSRVGGFIEEFVFGVSDASADTTIATLEAENMPTKTVGEATTGGWNIWSNGYVQQSMSFPVAGSYKFVIRAFGSKANNVWPNMALRIDGARVSNVTVGTTTYTDYTFTRTMTSGNHTIGAEFTNDGQTSTEDRNLYVDKITVIQITSTSTDTTPPSAPANLTATAISTSQINLSWVASTDNVGVTGYRIYRAGVQIGTSTTTSYSNTGLTAATSYSYTVKAIDAAGNLSAASNTASATTMPLADTTAPTAPASLTATVISASQINLSWNASTDNVGVTGYKIYRAGVEIGTSTATSYSNTGLTASTSYSYTVKAYDAANNLSAVSNTAAATTQANPPPPVGGVLDFTTFTEVDPTNKITISSNCVNTSYLSHLNSASYVTKPMAVSGNFSHDFDLKIDAISEYTNDSRYPLVWGISDSANKTHNTWANGLYIGIGRNAFNTPDIKLIRMTNGVQSVIASTAGIFNFGVTRYVRISRNSTTVTVSVYSDSARTQLLGSITGGNGFNGSYFYALSTRPINNQWVTMTASVCNLNTGVDSVVPTVPTGLTATAISANQINLSWNASTDNVGVTKYKIYQAGAELGESLTTTYSHTGLSSGTAYSYTVKAVDAAGNLSVASNSASATTQSIAVTFVQNVVYNANGQMTKLQLGDGTTKDYTYDPLMQRLTRMVTKTAAGITLQDLQYRYDAIGNIIEIIDSVNTASQTFKYDHLSRLTEAKNPARYGTKTYIYDTIGNITQKDGKNYLYGDGPAGPHAVTSVSGSPVNTFTYDLNGNMLTKQEGTQITFFAYDVENRLTSVKKGTSLAAAVNVETYNYDGDGGRVKKTSYNNGVFESTTEFVGSLFEKIGSTQVLHIFLGDSRIASLKSGEANFYHADHLGGTNVVTNSTGVVQELVEYEPYGDFSRQDKPGAGAGVANYYFTNQFRDQKTGLYFYGARYYDPKLGRFITPDTFIQSSTDSSQTFNRYSYCGNNPVNFVDPTGHWFFPAIAAIVKAVAAFAVAHPVITAGIISSAVNVGTNAGNISSFADFAKFASIGYVSGAAGGAAGIGTYGFLGKGVGVFWKTVISAGVGGLGGSLVNTVGNVAAFGGDFGSSLRFWAQNAPTIAGISMGLGAAGYGVGKVGEGIGKVIDSKAGTKATIGQQQNSNTGSLNVDQGKVATGKQALSSGDQKVRISVEIIDVTAPDGANVTGHRYVGKIEADIAASTGFVPNVDKAGLPKSVYYTPDTGLSSGAQAQKMYNLPNTPTYRLDLDTRGLTNTYGGNGQGIDGIEMITNDKIPVLGVGKLGQ